MVWRGVAGYQPAAGSVARHMAVARSEVAAALASGDHPAPVLHGQPGVSCPAIRSEDDVDATDLCFTPALELGRMIRARDVSPVEIAEAVLARIERLNPTLNAFLTVTSDLALDQARAAEARAMRGELRGPHRRHSRSRSRTWSRWPGCAAPTARSGPRTTSPAWTASSAGRLRAAGGVILGKTNTPHFGYKDMCDNLLGRPVQEPLEPGADLGRVVGRGRRGGRRPDSGRWPTARMGPARSGSRRRCAASSGSSRRSGGCRTAPAPTTGRGARTSAR